VVSTPYFQSSIFWGVTALAANDVWAVGESTQGKSYHAVTEHWNGSSWSVVPDDAPLGTQLLSVVAIATDDVWAVGGAMGSTVTEHWDGTQWTLIPSPNVGVEDMLWGVAAASSNDVWAVGSYRNGSIYPTLLEHWDGTQWTQVPGPDPDPSNNFLYGVAMVPSGEAWAVGSAGNGLILHYSDPCVTPSPTLSPSRTATPIVTPSASPTQSPVATDTAVVTGTPPTACTLSFEDVPPDHTFYAYIQCLACRGIINGYPCGGPGEPCDANNDPYFRPGNSVSRGQLSKIISNSAGFSDAQPDQLFEDVPVGSTFHDFIGRLASRGYISGYPCGGAGEPCGPGNLPYFRPNSNASRGQISKIDSNAANYLDDPVGQQFEDVQIGSTYYTYTYRLVTHSVMSGYPCGGAGEPCGPTNLPYFRPNDNASRGQTSKIVSNTFFPFCSIPAGR
jgi:hypothetical protein